MHMIHHQPFALDIPTLGVVGVEPGEPFEVPDADVEQLLDQGFEPADETPEEA